MNNSVQINPSFKPMSAEDRAKANEIKEEKRKWALENLKQDFEDISVWKELSSKFSVRLPIYYAAGTEIKFIKRMAKKLGVNIDEFLENSGFTTLKQMALSNPTWPAYALCGLLLEYNEEVNGEKVRTESIVQEH